MSSWPAVTLESPNLQAVALALRRRVDAIRPLVADLKCERVQDVEEVSPQGGIPHERIDLSFTLQSDRQTKISITLYDDGDYWLRISGRLEFVSEGRLPSADPTSIARMVEETLQLVARDAATEQIRGLWGAVPWMKGGDHALAPR